MTFCRICPGIQRCGNSSLIRLALCVGIRKLRQQQPGLPALLISGDTAPERLREARAEGLILLHKPVAVETLLTAIQQTLEGDA